MIEKNNFLNKHRSEVTTQPKNKNSDYVIDPTIRNINRFFFLSFKNSGKYFITRLSLDEYYTPLVQIRNFLVLIVNKPIFDKKQMKNFFKGQEIMTIRQEIIRLFVSSNLLQTQLH